MDSALIISYSEKSAEYLEKILNEASVADITTVSNAGEARRLLLEKDFDLCIINAPLPDEFGGNIAVNIAANGISEVILIVNPNILMRFRKVEDFGVITTANP